MTENNKDKKGRKDGSSKETIRIYSKEMQFTTKQPAHTIMHKAMRVENNTGYTYIGISFGMMILFSSPATTSYPCIPFDESYETAGCRMLLTIGDR